MTAVENINSKICYAEGPQGQRVVIVPPRTQTEAQGQSTSCYYCCFGCMISVAIFCFLMGTYHIVIAIYQYTNLHHSLNYLGFIILASAALSVVFSILCWRKAGRVKAKRVLQYMHRDDPRGRRTSEEENQEEFGLRYERRAVPPEASQPYHTPPLQPLIPTGTSPGFTDQLPSS
ncbi:uncharacterized protein [Macrobrachium rosenbergii]|uniref:uncharacterized protein n=1 Tax=Macrobrachium rosenbergii TaxID=79674 RepID=UPI0034D6730D